MSIRSFLSIEDERYAEFVREERHFTAILFHALHQGDNLTRLLDILDCGHQLSGDYKPAIYYEFAFLRDAWNKITSDDTKAKVIRRLLPKEASPRSKLDTTFAFNEHFGAEKKEPEQKIQSPGTWKVASFDRNIASNDAFRATCLFKWSFNAKPDLVIQTDNSHCVCIEAKLDSREARYPSSKADINAFKRRKLERVRQTEIQSYLMNELLGFESTNVLLSRGGRERESRFARTISWKIVFGGLNLQTLPEPMKASLKAKFGVPA